MIVKRAVLQICLVKAPETVPWQRSADEHPRGPVHRAKATHPDHPGSGGDTQCCGFAIVCLSLIQTQDVRANAPAAPSEVLERTDIGTNERKVSRRRGDE